jgi:hypothetical protein
MVGEGVAGIAAFQDLHEGVGAVLVFLDLLLHVGEGGTPGDLGDVGEFSQEFVHRFTVFRVGGKIIKNREKYCYICGKRRKDGGMG